MTNREPRLLSLILLPAIISNLMTLFRLALELSGYPSSGINPREITWWTSLWLLIPLAGIYFAFLLRDTPRPYGRLLLTLYVYALSVRVLTAIIYGLSGALGWHTHYSSYGPGVRGYLLGGLFPQLVLWPIITVIVGSLVGVPLLLLLRSGRSARPASI